MSEAPPAASSSPQAPPAAAAAAPATSTATNVQQHQQHDSTAMMNPHPPPNPMRHPQEPLATFEYLPRAAAAQPQGSHSLLPNNPPLFDSAPVLLEAALAAAHATAAAHHPHHDTTTAADEEEDPVAMAAMQEAATIVMQAHEKMQYEQPYSYADANATLRTTDGGTTTSSNSFTVRRPRSLDDNNDDDEEGRQAKKPRRPPTPRVPWEERLELLQAYKKEHGDLLVPTRYTGLRKLGKFVHNIREQYKIFCRDGKSGLTEVRILQLEDMGFQWNTQRNKKEQDDWESRFAKLEEFKAKNGHCNVPHSYKVDPSFGEWIHRQRTAFHKIQKDKAKGKLINPTVEERCQRLEKLGFLFQIQSCKWMDQWRALKEYKEKHSDCQVPTHYAENPQLGRWVHSQRHQRRVMEKGGKAAITKERIALLDELGFSWEMRPALERARIPWRQRFEELQAYAQRHGGSVNVYPEEAPDLQSWCMEQRARMHWSDRHKGDDRRISAERVQLLKSIGFTKDTDLHTLVYGRTIDNLPPPAPAVVAPASSTSEGMADDQTKTATSAAVEPVVLDAGDMVDKVMGDTDLGGAVSVATSSQNETVSV